MGFEILEQLIDFRSNKDTVLFVYREQTNPAFFTLLTSQSISTPFLTSTVTLYPRAN